MSWFAPWRANSRPSRSSLSCIRLSRVFMLETQLGPPRIIQRATALLTREAYALVY